ncbi:AraC family transcriptional regulator [Allorhizocola rhizosphaerae]|uniref:AraC family transcriptional regulator n=1 Tax=Allorhizocola rhizosphaerae TaxID=1872709 RepID=UPI000E3C922C|nr:helix-turn-helix transcriptional regulator [Allorhizocola rhizosphaerae]
MSQDGHVPPGFSATRLARSRALAVATLNLPSGTGFTPHTHAEHQLTWAQSGALSMRVDERVWVLPPTLALWMPAGLPHAVDAHARSVMYGLYLSPASCPIPWTEPTVVAVDGLLGALIVHLAGDGPAPAERARAEAVLFDLVRPVSVTTVAARMPRDDRALAVAKLLSEDPADSRSLDVLGRGVGASGRTLARLFLAETGLTFARWREQTRLRAALELLARGLPVSTVAHRVGYANPSAFVAMFRRLTGTTPGAYFTH